MKKVNISINGKPYVVEVEDVSARPLSVIVNGKTYTVEVEREPEAALASKTGVAKAPEIRVLSNGQANGQARATTMVRPITGSVGSGTITAPMPGKILAVKVSVGDKVSFGDEMVVLEAMKMENLVRTQVAGVVKEVKVTPLQSVAFGDVLVVIE